MSNRQRIGLAVASLTLFAVVGAMAQLPDPDTRPPAFPQGVTPGDIDLGKIDKTTAAPQAPTPAAGAPPTPAFGYIHQFGSFQVMGDTAEAMLMLSATLPPPDGRRTVDFYHATLRYVGRHTEPSTGITGFLYVTDIGPPVDDQRYILFGDRNLNIQDPQSNGVRWVVYYNSAGKRTYYTTARFYRP